VYSRQDTPISLVILPTTWDPFLMVNTTGDRQADVNNGPRIVSSD
jgi:hypothetical protein